LSLIHGLTWLDWALVVLVLGFAVRGVIRGSVAQVFALCAVVAGLWTAFWVSRWVGAHWLGARPAVVFVVLKWIVATLAALASMSLVQWFGDRLSSAVRESPVAWLDRIAGFVVGAGVGALVSAIIMVLALLLPWPHQPGKWVAKAQVSHSVLSGAERACRWGDRVLPYGDWLERRFEDAALRVRPSVHPS
jgi:uncharacterized membrane protein required for colicin V production